MGLGALLLKVVVTYAAAVIAMAVALIGWYSYQNPGYVWSPGELLFSLTVPAIFGLPIYALVGLPYLALGYQSWGRDHEVVFVVLGIIIGGLGGAAYGALLAMPLPIPPFMPIAGVLAGGVCSFVWLLLSRNRVENRIA